MKAARFALLLCVFGRGIPAVAQETGGQDARSLFLRGLQLADEERWGDAVQHFERSLALQERASTFFNLGLALVRMARYTDAIATFERYLSVSDPLGDAATRTQAEEMLLNARSSLASVQLSVAPDTASIEVDGVSVDGTGSARQLELDPGHHTLSVAALGYETRSIELSLLSGATEQVSVELAANVPEVAPVSTVSEASPILAPSIADRPVEESSGGMLSSPVFWVVAGVVVVGAGVGIGVAVASSGDDPSRYMGSTGVTLRP